MQDFLAQIAYNAWILPALLIIPLVGALLLLVMGAFSSDDGTLEAARSARWIALLAFVIEFVVSLGLWWSYDPAGALASDSRASPRMTRFAGGQSRMYVK